MLIILYKPLSPTRENAVVHRYLKDTELTPILRWGVFILHRVLLFAVSLFDIIAGVFTLIFTVLYAMSHMCPVTNTKIHTEV